MGRVIGEDGKPIIGAIIKVSNRSAAVETRSDRDGLYYTTLLPSGTYRIAMVHDGRYLKAKKIYFYAEGPKKYYVLCPADNKLKVEVTEKNVFMDARLTRVVAGQRYFDVPDNRAANRYFWRIRNGNEDSAAGQSDPVRHYGENIPQTKEIK